MAHVVTERCVDCRYTDCCAVCPVECFYEVESPALLVIDPQTCIDCGLCIPECPIWAIYPMDEVPEPYKVWIARNAELFPKGKQITAKKDALPSAIPIDKIHEKEKARGMKVADPSAVGGSGASTAATAKKAAPKAADAGPAKPAEGVPSNLSPAEAAKAQASSILQKKMAAAQSAPPPPGAPAGYHPAPLALPKRAPRPPVGVNVGGRIRLGFRQATVQEMRRGPGKSFIDVRLLFDGEEKPTWYLYSSLQTFKEKGELEVLKPGPRPGIIQRMLGAG